MDIRSLSLFLFLGVLFTSFDAYSTNQTVYRWVDENNVVHFSQQKPFDNTIKNIEAVTTYKASEHKKTGSLIKNKDDVEIKDNDVVSSGEPIDEAEVIALAAKNKLKKEQAFKHNCEAAEKNLSMLNSFKRVIYPDKNGVNHVLSPQEKADRIKLNKEHIDTYCLK